MTEGPAPALEELLLRHQKERRDLSSRITQRKKSATKKTRKLVHDECENLERDLTKKQENELRMLQNGPDTDAVDHAPRDELDLAALVQAEGEPQTDVQNKMDSLSIASPRPPEDEQNTTQGRTRKPNRQKLRLARKAAQHEALLMQAEEEAANLPDLKTQERSRMLEEIAKHDLQEQEVAANGHCMYLAIADQLSARQLQFILPKSEEASAEASSSGPDYKALRKVAATYIDTNPDDFSPFVEEPLPEYTRKIRDTGEWGGELELMALANAYNLEIKVLQADGSIHVVRSSNQPQGVDASNTVWLAYYKHGFGLGEHYNSLRRKSKGS